MPARMSRCACLHIMQRTEKTMRQPREGGKRVGYKRVSTILQSTDRQLDGIAVDKLFEDHVSGKDRNRPQLRACLEYLRDGDVLVVHSIDRLARNLEDLLRIVRDLTQRGVAVEFVTNNLVFSGDDPAASVLTLSILGAVAQFERSLLLERQREGIEIARRKGMYRGRKQKLEPERVKELRARIAAGAEKKSLAREYGISRAALYNYIGREPYDR